MEYIHQVFKKIDTIKISKTNSYILVFFSVLIVYLIQSLINSYFKVDTSPLVFIVPILISALYGGLIPGLAATILSLLIGDFFFDKIHGFSLYARTDLVNHGVLIIEGLLISIFGESRKHAEQERQGLLMLEKQARKNAEQQTRIREHFIAVAAHELKSPLTSQKAYIQLLIKATRNIECECQKYLPKIEEQVNRIKVFLDDLMDVSKMQTRNLHYKFDFIDINKCLDEAIDQIHDLLITHKIIRKGKIKKTIFADNERIRQVLTNLLSNAIKYSPEANKIIIVLNENKKNVTICVKDFGIGIDKEYQDKIFNRFYRVTGSDESMFKGLGLGLYLCSGIIKKHKGKLWFESKKGKGSSFYFTVPIKSTIK